MSSFPLQTARQRLEDAERHYDSKRVRLVRLGEALEAVEDEIAGTVADMRAAGTYSWAQIGNALGVSKQAAQQRYGRRR